MTDITQLLASTDTTIAVVGATDSPGKYGGIIYRDLKGLGYRVRAVNPNRSIVDGDECYPNLAALPERPDIIDVVVPAATGLGVAREAVSLGYGNVWLQPGAEGPALLAFLEDQHVPHLADSCIMVVSRRILRGR
jgi:predicted CoA-binding protein